LASHALPLAKPRLQHFLYVALQFFSKPQFRFAVPITFLYLVAVVMEPIMKTKTHIGISLPAMPAEH